MTHSDSVRSTVDYIGIADYKNQLFRRFRKNGLEFNIMVVGETGLGKTTFINNLFFSDVCQLKAYSTTKVIQERTFFLLENNVRIKVTLVDTPGFGNELNNCYCWRPLTNYIDKRNSEYLSNELKVNRLIKAPDTRIHVCLYFISPTGHGLKTIDKICLRKLYDKVNLIPIIGKADTLTKIELNKFKQTILNELNEEGIKIYNFPEINVLNQKIISDYSKNLPYAIVCSTNVIINKYGVQVRVREYPWGKVEVDNLNHNDFIALKDDLMKKYLIDLILDTNNVHYENYRYTQLSEIIEKNDSEGSLMFYLDFDTRINKDFNEIIKNKEKIFEESVKKRIVVIEEKEKHLDAMIEEKINILENKKRILAKLIKEIEKMKINYGSSLIFFHKHPSTINEAKKKLRRNN